MAVVIQRMRVTGLVMQWFLKSPARVHSLFGVLLAIASLCGRATVPPGGSYAFVWPAAGIAFLWLVWAWESRDQRGIGCAGVFAVFALFNGLTGLPPGAAVLSGLAGLVQPMAAVVLFKRLSGSLDLRSVGDYFRLGLAGVLGSTVGGGFMVAAAWVLQFPEVPELAPWVLRNAVSLVAIGSLGLLIAQTLMEEGRFRTIRVTGERVALVVSTFLLYGLSFGQPQGLPISFIALPVNIWAGARLRTTSSMSLAIISGGLVVLLTVAGLGPFQNVGGGTTPAYIAQAFIFLAFSISAVMGLFRDERRRLLTELRKASSEAQAAARLRGAIFANLTDGILVVGARGIVLQNEVSRNLLGRSDPEPGGSISEHYDIRLTDGSRYPEQDLPVHRALAGETVQRAELDSLTPDGKMRHLSVDAVPLELEDGPGAVVVFHDVTEERRHQAQLTRFAAVVAHDLGSPLTIFDGWLELLEDEDLPEGEKVMATRAMRTASTRMRTLISNLLTYSLAKEDRVKATRINVADVCEAIVSLRTSTPDGKQAQSATVSVDADVTILADPNLFNQLMDNLIGNALKYSHPERAATVTVTGRTDEETGWTRIAVADNGIGIPEADVDSIFEEFHRSVNGAARAAGTGLGLSICRRIVESHGGTITVQNRPEGGSQFTLTLPSEARRLPPHVDLHSGAEAAHHR